MSSIQIDMFEVQLGAALLLQFRTPEGQTVRVLADAGVKASGYAPEHVHDKLFEAFASFGDPFPRLDLILGTHYDEDHLQGLVPIIDDRAIEIGEAWLPPVANDTELHALDESLRDSDLLAFQFARDDGGQRLHEYLERKCAVCEEVGTLERLADEFRPERARRRSAALRERAAPPSVEPGAEDVDLDRAADRRRILRDFVEWAPDAPRHDAYFRRQLRDVNATLGIEEYAHCDDDIGDEIALEEAERQAREARPLWSPKFSFVDPGGTAEARGERCTRRWQQYPSVVEADVANLAFIRRANAKDAITAIALAKVVRALRARGIPIVCRVIRDGIPRRFVWRAKEGRFVPGAQLACEGPELTLLGPSEGLVKKHCDRLPVGDYVARLSTVAIPIKSITPSNELSYVARFGLGEEGILVAGDAGFVDFKPKRGDYHPELLHALLPLHVIQVAHHAGNNAHFYRALLAADYPGQEARSLMLLSHATHDKHRPSREFGLFVEEVRKEGNDVQLLFTSEPTADKVRDYREIIHKVEGAPGRVGDVRIEFDRGQWRVLRHAVQA